MSSRKTNSRAVAAPAPLLYSREQVAAMLGNVSIHTVRRLEAQGRLHPIRLTKSPSAMVFFKAQDVLALVEEASH
jgi:hypothetical protein